MDLTLKEVESNGEAVGSYISRRTLNRYTIWQLNWADALVSVIVDNSQNEIAVIYNATTNQMVFISPDITLRLGDLRVIK